MIFSKNSDFNPFIFWMTLLMKSCWKQLFLTTCMFLNACAGTSNVLSTSNIKKNYSYDGLYVAEVELARGTPSFCALESVRSKPWLIINGEIRFRLNGGAQFSSIILPDSTFYGSKVLGNGSSLRLSGRVTTNTIYAETDNPSCQFRFNAEIVKPAFGTAAYDGIYKGRFHEVENRLNDFLVRMNGGCARDEETTFYVRRGYITANFSGAQIVAAPLDGGGNFIWDRGGWKFEGSIKDDKLSALVTNPTCIVAVEGVKTSLAKPQ